MWRTLSYKDENGQKIKHLIVERKEQILSEQFINPNAVVLELGARYGTVSCVINKILNDKNNQVSVEPDQRVWEALENNMKTNDCSFNIIKGFISNKKMSLENLDCWYGYGSSSVEDTNSTIPSFTLEYAEQLVGKQFDTVVADCEGFLEQFFNENPRMYSQIKTIIFEKDYPKVCDYDLIKRNLTANGLRLVGGISEKTGKPLFREAWQK